VDNFGTIQLKSITKDGPVSFTGRLVRVNSNGSANVQYWSSGIWKSVSINIDSWEDTLYRYLGVNGVTYWQ